MRRRSDCLEREKHSKKGLKHENRHYHTLIWVGMPVRSWNIVVKICFSVHLFPVCHKRSIKKKHMLYGRTVTLYLETACAIYYHM